MKFSERWLREWLDLTTIDSKTLTEQLTMVGLEVASIEPVTSNFTGVVVGRVIECYQHDGNNVWLTKVDIGGERRLNIVCSAKNCRTQLLVAVATIGAILPGNVNIQSTIRYGKLSEGMLCSFAELGINSADHSMITLPEDASIGDDIRDYLQLDDNIIDLSVTPNRADCLSMLGIAREVAVINRLQLQLPQFHPVAPVINDTLPIMIEVPNACPRYLGRIVKNIDVSRATPLWMKEKLRRGGIYSVNAVVDITNYVLLELGQPMHAFDLNTINDSIVIRLAQDGEKMTKLDGNEVILTSDTLVIANKNQVLAIAGITGSVLSSISHATRNVLLECAWFSTSQMMGCSRSYGLHTEASLRYEHGVDPALLRHTMERATALLVDICGGQPGPVIDVTTAAALPQSATITLRRAKLDRLIGYIIPNDDVSDILTRLGCELTCTTNDSWLVRHPSWRFDLKIEADLIEEVVRIYGYHNIPHIPIHANLEMYHNCEAALPLSRVKTLLIDRSYQEAITYSFVDPKMQRLLHPEQDGIQLSKPLTVAMSAMRLSLWPGLISAVVYNQNRQQQRIRLFESGYRFIKDNSVDLGIRQDLMLAGVITGPRCDEHWDISRKLVDFYDVKGDIEAILELTGKLEQIEFRAPATISSLHAGQSAAIYLNGDIIGCLGVLHPKLEEPLHLNGRTLLFELIFAKIAHCNVPKATAISRFPSNRRDIAVIVSEDICAADLIAECKKVAANNLVGIKLFDVYRGVGIAEGFKSLAISLILQNQNRTLEEEDIAATVAKCVAALKQRFQATLRDGTYGTY